MEKRYAVRLLPAERTVLGDLLAAGTAPARTLAHARILLKADQGPDGPAWADARIAEAVETSPATVARVRRRWAEGGLDDALHRRPTGPRTRRLDGAQEARLIAVACSTPPTGHARWTLRLLADRLVELGVVEGIPPPSHRSTRRRRCSRGREEFCEVVAGIPLFMPSAPTIPHGSGIPGGAVVNMADPPRFRSPRPPGASATTNGARSPGAPSWPASVRLPAGPQFAEGVSSARQGPV